MFDAICAYWIVKYISFIMAKMNGNGWKNAIKTEIVNDMKWFQVMHVQWTMLIVTWWNGEMDGSIYICVNGMGTHRYQNDVWVLLKCWSAFTEYLSSNDSI